MFLMQLTTLHLEQMYAANDLLFFVAIQFVLGNIAFLGFDMSYVAIEHSKPDADSDNGNVSFTWTLNLEPEDQVHLKIESGTYYVDADATSSRIYFTAFLMKASA